MVGLLSLISGALAAVADRCDCKDKRGAEIDRVRSKLTPETAVIIDLAPYRFFHWLFTGCAQGASLCHSHQVTKCLGLRLCSYSREGRLAVLCQQCRIPSQQLHVRAPQAPPRNELGSKGTLNRRVGTLLAGYWAGSLRGARIRMRPETGATRIQDLLLGVPKKGTMVNLPCQSR